MRSLSFIAVVVVVVPTEGFNARWPAPRLWTSLAATSKHSSESLTVLPISKCTGEIVLPGSKSLSNRALLLAALSVGDTKVENLLASDDTSYMLKALAQLGVGIEAMGPRAYKVTGHGGAFENAGSAPMELFLGNAGTAMRPLAAALCFGRGKFVLDGVEVMLLRSPRRVQSLV